MALNEDDSSGEPIAGAMAIQITLPMDTCLLTIAYRITVKLLSVRLTRHQRPGLILDPLTHSPTVAKSRLKILQSSGNGRRLLDICIPSSPFREGFGIKILCASAEAERKKLFRIARLRELHGRHQPQPFLNTALGKLSPGIRVMIYQYLVVVNQQDDPSATMSLLLAAPPSIASQRFFKLKKSGLSILRDLSPNQPRTSLNF